MKKLFIAVMALATIVSCSKENEEPNVTPVSGKKAFLSVSLNPTTRAAAVPGNYEVGSADENEITSATFYFFDAVGAPYVVDTDNAVEVDTKALTLNAGTNNIEAYSDVILVIKESQETPPAKMVAILNGPDMTGETLAEVKEATTAYATEGGFVMSNSVYKGDKGEVYATEILPENIFTTPDPAEGVEPGDVYAKADDEDLDVAPVMIYVERVAARVDVEVDITTGVLTVNNEKLYPVTLSENASDKEKDTYVKVLGWDVTNAAKTSNLLKVYAEPIVGSKTLFNGYNVPTAFRSHWASTPNADPEHTLKFSNIQGKTAATKYYNENTNSPVNEEGWYNGTKNFEGATKASQIIVAAQLVDAEGNPKQFAKWYGKDYSSLDAIKGAMINNAAKQIFVKAPDYSADNQRFVGIGITDVEFNQVGEGDYTPEQDVDRRYEVRVEAINNETKYFDSKGEKMSVADVTAILETIEPAKIWTSGYTYYYTLVNHYGDANGMVRNHLYDIKIKSFKGLGTPIYDVDDFIIYPENPDPDEFYSLTAQINVLSWALVSQDVNLGN